MYIILLNLSTIQLEKYKKNMSNVFEKWKFFLLIFYATFKVNSNFLHSYLNNKNNKGIWNGELIEKEKAMRLYWKKNTFKDRPSQPPTQPYSEDNKQSLIKTKNKNYFSRWLWHQLPRKFYRRCRIRRSTEVSILCLFFLFGFSCSFFFFIKFI